MDILSNLRSAYIRLEDAVNSGLQTQVGDHQRLGCTRNDALHFLLFVEAVRNQ